MNTIQKHKKFRDNTNNNLEDIITVLKMAKSCDELRKKNGKPTLDLLSILYNELNIRNQLHKGII